MNNSNEQHIFNDSAPVSEISDQLTQTLLRTKMMDSPQNPGNMGQIDKFEIIEVLGVGGMGQVLLARDPGADSLVAIKMIKPEFLADPQIKKRFLTEARHMFKMSHPNIINVLEIADREDGPYYVMPYIEKGSLARLIRSGEPLDEDQILNYCQQIGEALRYAHSRGIIHRDLKPENVLVDAEGHAYLTDFGLLRTVFNDSIIDVQKSAVEGTAPYMSPGVAEGKAEDTRCDIYAFGAMLYQMLTGLPPYEGANPFMIIKQILDGPPKTILKLNPKAPEKLVMVAEKAMARELRGRYAEMADLLADLERIDRGGSPLPENAGDASLKVPEESAKKESKNLKMVHEFWMAIVCMITTAAISISFQYVNWNAKPGTKDTPKHEVRHQSEKVSVKDGKAFDEQRKLAEEMARRNALKGRKLTVSRKPAKAISLLNKSTWRKAGVNTSLEERKTSRSPNSKMPIFIELFGKKANKKFDSTSQVIDLGSIGIDDQEKFEGDNSIKLSTPKPTGVLLGELKDLDIDNCALVYQAKVKSDLKGEAYLEMWVRVYGQEYFSKGLNDVVSQKSDWKTIQTRFFLKKGQKADKVFLNLVVKGKGTVWIDAIDLLQEPLPDNQAVSR